QAPLHEYFQTQSPQIPWSPSAPTYWLRSSVNRASSQMSRSRRRRSRTLPKCNSWLSRESAQIVTSPLGKTPSNGNEQVDESRTSWSLNARCKYCGGTIAGGMAMTVLPGYASLQRLMDPKMAEMCSALSPRDFI